ncbi:MAG: D-alanyl-D-alanine carboxypeptidase/D-alanyl-D-alanine-endopeptidase [bacterium]
MNAKPGRHLLALHLLALALLTACAPLGRLEKPATAEIDLPELQRRIDTILQDSVLAHSRVGIKIVSLASGQTVYEKNSHLLFHPASNMKLLTTATALTRLGTNFTFKTILYADTAAVFDSVIVGNLYLKGFADPELSLTDLAWMAQQLKKKGIRRITGDLVCDDTTLDELYRGAGWMWDDASSWYYAPIGALTVNDNCVTVAVKPGARVGDSLQVRLDPPTAYMKVANLGLTVDSLDTIHIKKFKVQRKWITPENTVVISGGLPPGAKERRYVIDVVNPTLFTGTLFAEALEREAIELSGQIVAGELPDTNVVLVTHLSQPLASVVRNTNKISDNLSAELILKTVGAELKGTPGTAKKGLAVVKEFLHEAGVDTTALSLADGSGSSRYNQISPDHIMKVLQAMHKDFRLQAEFKASLPIAGVDGTLRHRMKTTPAEGKLRAKTGNLRGVSALSGYTTTATGELLAFAMIMEHFVARNALVKQVQDRIGSVISGMGDTSK